MGATLGSLTEIRELKTEITGLRSDLKRFIERANQQHVDSVLGNLKKNYAGLFASHQVDSAKETLSRNMVGDCKMRDTCFDVFMKLLESSAQHIKDGQVSEELIQSYRDQMEEMKKNGQFDRCDTCFTQVYQLFEKQIGLMQSLGIYAREKNPEPDLSGCPEETIVKEIVEPIANIQRFQILRALSSQTRTFSDLSQLTGLRGGNLLFHIRKLTDTGMILQRHERGDYIITEKGFKTLFALSDLYTVLNPQ